jgi:hypothetical protein
MSWKLVMERGRGGLEGDGGKGRGFLNMDIRHNRSKRTKQRLLLFILQSENNTEIYDS